MTRPSYLVTGGAGFIGSHLVEALVRRGCHVRVLDNLSTGKRSNLAPFDGVEFIEGDCADLEVAMRAVAGNGHVLHQAAIVSALRSVHDRLTLTERTSKRDAPRLLVGAPDARVKRFVRWPCVCLWQYAVAADARRYVTAPCLRITLQKTRGRAILRDAALGSDADDAGFTVFGPRRGSASPRPGVIALFATALLQVRCLSSSRWRAEYVTSFTWRTSSTACCLHAKRRAQPARSSISRRVGVR